MKHATTQMQFASLIYPFDHLSTDQKMALITHCIKEYFYSVACLHSLLEYADEAFERSELNLNLISELELVAELNESILINLCPDEIYDLVIDRNRTTAEADNILYTPCVVDLMNQQAGIEVRKNVTAE